MAIFADVQYCIYDDIVGGFIKVQKYADVIQGWSLKSRTPELRLKKSIKDKDSLTRIFF